MDRAREIALLLCAVVIIAEGIYIMIADRRARQYRKMWKFEMERSESISMMAVMDEMKEKEDIEMREVLPDERT